MYTKHEQNQKNPRAFICVTIHCWALNYKIRVNYELQRPKKRLSIWMLPWRPAPILRHRMPVSPTCYTLYTSTSTASSIGRRIEVVARQVQLEWPVDDPDFIYSISEVANNNNSNNSQGRPETSTDTQRLIACPFPGSATSWWPCSTASDTCHIVNTKSLRSCANVSVR